MAPHHDQLTLDALLADPLTQLVMRSDGITTAEVAAAFATARLAMPERTEKTEAFLCGTTFERWLDGVRCCA